MMNDLLFGSQQEKQRRGNLWGRFVPWVPQWCWSALFSSKGWGWQGGELHCSVCWGL